MKIMIAGAGKLGSQIAFLTILKFKPEKIILIDVKDISGDVLDLQHACKGLNISTEITNKSENCDFFILSAGYARNHNIKTHKELLELNTPVIKQIIREIKRHITEKTKVIVLTNPVKEITEMVKLMLPNNHVENPEKILMNMRDGKELGWEIVSTKGYSNFGPAVSAVLLMEKIIKES